MTGRGHVVSVDVTELFLIFPSIRFSFFVLSPKNKKQVEN